MNPRSSRAFERPWVRSRIGLVLLDTVLKPIAFNAEAVTILSYPERPVADHLLKIRIPEEILEAIRRPNASVPAPIIAQFRAGKRKYFCQAFVMKAFKDCSPQPAITLLLQRNSSAMEVIHEVAAEFGLTERERELLQGISNGLTSKELAEEMDISPNTVKAHVRVIMVKMRVNTRAGIVAKILEHNPFLDGDLISAGMLDNKMSAGLQSV